MSGTRKAIEGTQVVDGHGPQPKPSHGDPYVASVPEAAALLGISKDLAYDLARRGELPGAFQLGRRWRVSLVRFGPPSTGPSTTEPSKLASSRSPRFESVSVDPQCHRGVGMPQPPGHGPHVGPTGDGRGGGEVAQFVKVGRYAELLGRPLVVVGKVSGWYGCPPLADDDRTNGSATR